MSQTTKVVPMKNQSSTSHCWANISILLVNEGDVDSYYYTSHLINLFGKKFQRQLNCFVSRFFILNKFDLNDIQLQLKRLLLIDDDNASESSSLSSRSEFVLLLTTAVHTNDSSLIIDRVYESLDLKNNSQITINKLVDESFRIVQFSNRRTLIMLHKKNQQSLDKNLAILFDHFLLLNEQNFKHIDFDSQSARNTFLKLNSELIYGDDALESSTSNYSKFRLTFRMRNEMASSFDSALLESTLLNDSLVNADYYVYNLESLSEFLNDKLKFRVLVNEKNNNNGSTSSSSRRGANELVDTLMGKRRHDLEFLRTKVELSHFYRKLANSLEIIEQTFNKYNSNQICVSFNGGKDCCVVLYLFYAVAMKLGIRWPLRLLFIRIEHDFDEMSEFIERTLRSFYDAESLEFILIDEKKRSLKECLIELKQLRPDLSSILMGTRRTDGSYFKNMKPFEPTDGDWPRFMRVNPILDWEFSEIWYFIRLLSLPYCSLYDQGYTSLDSKDNTIPNSALLIAANNSNENNNTISTTMNASESQQQQHQLYLPAFMLNDGNAERNSRKPKNT